MVGNYAWLHPRESNALLPGRQAQPTGRLVVITTAPPVRIFLLVRFAAFVQIRMLSMSIVFPLIVVDGFLRAATRHEYGSSYPHHQQEWSEVLNNDRMTIPLR